MSNYEYLYDSNFLKQLDEEPYKEIFIRIAVLDFKTESVIANIEGKSTGGNININGSSAMRRTMSCSLVADPQGIQLQGKTGYRQYSNITEVENIISLNKKIRVEVGISNILKKNLMYNAYSKYDIIWFPQGTYVIKAASIAQNNAGINISLTLNDKTSLLNGDMGGTIPAATVFSESEKYSIDGFERTVDLILIKDIIKHIVVNFGGEKPENIIITDVPDTALKELKWAGPTPLYLRKENDASLRYTLDMPLTYEKVYANGDSIGYMNEPFVYPGTLECAAGETVASVLDKIKNALGNFEWFYDIHGHFIFQEIKNYINNSYVTDYLALTENNYLSFINPSKSVYTFDNKKIVTSISNAPQFGNIKNDFVVWGSTKTITGTDKPIRYHVAFDNKPDIKTEPRFAFVYTDYRGLQQVIILNVKDKTENNIFYKEITELAEMTDKNLYYILSPELIMHWDEELCDYQPLQGWEACYLKTNDWRTELYFLGLETNDLSFEQNYYAAELNAEWPKIYNVRFKKSEEPTQKGYNIYEGGYINNKTKDSYEYWLDFLEGNSFGGVSQFNVSNIGRRTKVVTHNNATTIFPVSLENYYIIETDGETLQEIEEAVEKQQQTWIQMPSDIFKNCVMNNSQYSAYEKMKELLYTHTQYAETVALSAIPIYYLEPNTRITIEDNNTHVHGDYLIKSISLPLTANGVSNISCSRCVEKTF